MRFIRRPRWTLPSSAETPEAVFASRRQVLAGLGALALTPAIAGGARAEAGLFPAPRNDRFKLDRALTPEADNAEFNNFYEFGTSKQIARAAAKLKTRPWTVKIDGLVEKPLEIDAEDLMRKLGLEERLYRLRCVEAWSMTIPWTGFPLSRLVALARPLGSAKYLRMETFNDPKVAVGQAKSWFPWPYVEGLTMAEAANDLAFIAMGAYGKPLPNQHGAPLRLAVPWKYGFKSVKSIVRFSFVEERPKTFWEALGPGEYGFWANVNPKVAHPRWSQASEQVLGTRDRVPTLLYNGYAEEVADLYKGLEGEKLFV